MDRLARTAVIALLASGLLAACSPEAGRTRGGGPGADIGNRAPAVELHGQQDMYHETPDLGPAIR